jgi:hypothetical protein
MLWYLENGCYEFKLPPQLCAQLYIRATLPSNSRAYPANSFNVIIISLPRCKALFGRSIVALRVCEENNWRVYISHLRHTQTVERRRIPHNHHLPNSLRNQLVNFAAGNCLFGHPSNPTFHGILHWIDEKFNAIESNREHLLQDRLS